MNNCKISNFILKKLEYDFEDLDRKSISIFIGECIKIVEIDDKKALLNVTRELRLGKETESFLKICYDVLVENDQIITKNDLLTMIKNKGIDLIPVFSKISLLISQVTNLSPLGVIVTPPNYNSERVMVE